MLHDIILLETRCKKNTMAGFWTKNKYGVAVREWSYSRAVRGCGSRGEPFSRCTGSWLESGAILEVPGYPKEEGLLDYLGRLGVAGSSVEISRLLPVRFLAQNASPRDANSGKMISESSSIGWS